MENRADVQQLVPRLVPNQLFAGSNVERKRCAIDVCMSPGEERE